MKDIFKTDDNWDENSSTVKFNTKIKLKNKTRKGKEPLLNILEKQKSINSVDSAVSKKDKKKSKNKNGISKPLHEAEKNKLKKKTKTPDKRVDEDEYDGECRFTPLLRKNVQKDVSKSKKEKKTTTDVEQNSLEITEPVTDSTKKKNKSKKRKNSTADNEIATKKIKTIDQKNKLNGTTPKQDEEHNEKSLFNTDFANKLRENLLGGRFRFLNELLYTVPGKKAKEIFEQDEEAFKSYHQGYRQQVDKWPFNPLDRIIKRVRRLPKHMTVVDFGCGEAKLAESIPHKCFSIDLISSKPNVIACDMAHTPLKSQSVDVAVFALSLMGTNLKDFISEANRVLKKDGIVYVAEIGSRFENVKDFIKLWQHLGFELQRQDVIKKNFFYFFDFKKTENIKNSVLSIVNCSLKPCIYKKR